MALRLGSMHSLVASPYKSAYNAAKHGIAGFTKTVALETAQACLEPPVSLRYKKRYGMMPGHCPVSPQSGSRKFHFGTRSVTTTSDPRLELKCCTQAGNVTCNAVCPGYMLTELVEKQLAATAKLRGMSEVRRRHLLCFALCHKPIAFPHTCMAA